MVEVINQYEAALRIMWEKSFDRNHVVSRPTARGWIMKIVNEYFNQVYNKAHRKSKKKKKKKADDKEEKEKEEVTESQESIRSLNKKWQYEQPWYLVWYWS